MEEFTKKVKMEDRLSILPESLLITILSLLPTKEAVRTSVLSRRWRKLWTYIVNLNFDVSLLPPQLHYRKTYLDRLRRELRYVRKQQRAHLFITAVDQFMQAYRSTKLHTLRIAFCLFSEHSNSLNGWISSAISAGVENLELDMQADLIYLTEDMVTPYEFPLHFLANQSVPCLKHLRLIQCNLKGSDFTGFRALTSLHLEILTLVDEQLENLLLHCVHLEKLRLIQCSKLVTVKIKCSLVHLKYLMVFCCYHLKKVELHAENLASFVYGTDLIPITSQNALNLVKCYLRADDGSFIRHAITSLPYQLPQLQKLMLDVRYVSAIGILPDVPPMFTSLKHLILSFELDTNNILSWITRLLKASPLLQKLELHRSQIFKAYEGKIIQGPLKFAHDHLETVEISGLGRHWIVTEIVANLLDIASQLRLLMFRRQWTEKDHETWDINRHYEYQRSVVLRRQDVLMELDGLLSKSADCQITIL